MRFGCNERRQCSNNQHWCCRCSVQRARGALPPISSDPAIGHNPQVKLGIYNLFDHRNTTEISGDPTGLTSTNTTTLAYSLRPGRMVFGSISVGF